jgi:hypothetical protein
VLLFEIYGVEGITKKIASGCGKLEPQKLKKILKYYLTMLLCLCKIRNVKGYTFNTKYKVISTKCGGEK